MPADDETPHLPKASILLGNNASPATIRVPSFNQDRPGLWFAQLESQFRNHNVTNEVDKIHHAIPLIDTRIAADAEDIILNPPAENPYHKLKTALIACYSKSREAKLLQLLDGECLGDRTPFQHLRHLRSLVPGIDGEVLRARWLSHLPDQIRACSVAQCTAGLQELGEAAARLHDVLRPSTGTHVAATSFANSPGAVPSEVEQQLAHITKCLQKLLDSRQTTGIKHFRPRNANRSGSVSPVSPAGNTCWYHKKFGNLNQQCTPGCKLAENK
ncbi:PREDICTED: uncharacterized protein LOC108359101 [Rhagoletis zephyria]|uniref:uncharacterized protein LOC108359101 n=1 Tax=Rhagoletis zephyria TaxID=28612 RepID=UPI000811469F|nr:PREDICTED: uncharacterized protein LOC108359101 [Rhagoletis zephyria]